MNKEKDNSPAKVYLLPNLMTAGNMLCGFMAILNILEGTIKRSSMEASEWWTHYEWSLYFILGACIFDVLDGRLARLGGQESPFGREFDSIADIVSFGVAPALLVFKIVLWELYIGEFHAGKLIAMLYLICGGLRLARFNCLAATPGSSGLKDFKGFPIPAAAGTIASITLLLLDIYEDNKIIGNWKYVLAGLMIFLSFMMFSNVNYPSFKSIDWRTKKTIPYLIVLVLILAIGVKYHRYFFPFVFTSYLVYGFIRPYLSRNWRPDFDSDEDERPSG